MASNVRDDEEFVWDDRTEIKLFYAMLGLKPVGVNRHFMMMAIHHRFTNSINRQVSSKVIWDHLDTLYDMAALNESEVLPFPNEEVDFELPPDFNDVGKESHGVSLPHGTEESEMPKNQSSVKAVKKSGTSKLKQNSTPIVNAKKPANIESLKGKQEMQLSVKLNKIIRPLSPFSAKAIKSETASEAIENSVGKKASKTEYQTPTNSKKTTKSEQLSAKKSSKQEPNSSSSRQAKIETPDNSNKKGKHEKEYSGKKGKVITTDNSTAKKSSKVDAKKNETENIDKKSIDTPSNKTKSEKINKSLKYDDVDYSPATGSRKSSSKVDTTDKKKKRQKLEDSAKKSNLRRRN